MRTYLIVSAALATMGLSGEQAKAQLCYHDRVALVQNWYGNYLGRPVDQCGLTNWVGRLGAGIPPELVECEILGSDEYFHRHGCCPRRFIIAMYVDVLGRTPCRHDLEQWLCVYRQCGCRKTTALRFLRAAQAELASRPPVQIAPPAYQPPGYQQPGYQTPGYQPPFNQPIPNYPPQPRNLPFDDRGHNLPRLAPTTQVRIGIGYRR